MYSTQPSLERRCPIPTRRPSRQYQNCKGTNTATNSTTLALESPPTPTSVTSPWTSIELANHAYVKSKSLNLFLPVSYTTAGYPLAPTNAVCQCSSNF